MPYKSSEEVDGEFDEIIPKKPFGMIDTEKIDYWLYIKIIKFIHQLRQADREAIRRERALEIAKLLQDTVINQLELDDNRLPTRTLKTIISTLNKSL